VGRAQQTSGFEVAAHPHASVGEVVVAGELVEESEKRGGFDPCGRHAHQADDLYFRIPGLGEQGGQVLHRAATLLQFLADINLNEARHLPSGLVERLGERGDQARPIERMDAVEQPRRILRLVRLELPDEVQLRIGPPFAKRGPLGGGFLHPILAEHAVPGCEKRLDRFRRVGLADRDQGHFIGLAARDLAGAGNAVVDFVKAQRCVHGEARYSACMGKSLPDLWLLSDARNDELLPRALRALPQRSAFVFRHYHLDPKARRERFDILAPIALEHGHLLVLSGSDDQAKAWGAAGSYGPPEAVGEAPELMRIVTCHDGHEIAHANAAGADAAMLSPVFATRTHPNITPLGPEKFHALAALAEMPVIALGGMTFERAKELGWTRWAAIDGLALKQDS